MAQSCCSIKVSHVAPTLELIKVLLFLLYYTQTLKITKATITSLWLKTKQQWDLIVFPVATQQEHCFFFVNVTWIRNCALRKTHRKKNKKKKRYTRLLSAALTFFQSPFDRAGFLANSVQVSIQGGHKEQAFREGNCAGAAKPLQKKNILKNQGDVL